MSRPVISPYRQSSAPQRPHCVTCDDPLGDIIQSEVQSKNVVLVEGQDIDIEDLSNSQEIKYQISYDPYIFLSATLVLTARSSGLNQSQPILKGTTVDEVDLSWIYNKPVTAQSLLNTLGLADPLLLAPARSFTYIGQTITEDIAFTLTGDDGTSRDGGVINLASKIVFGNYFAQAVSKNLTGALSSSLQALFDGATRTAQTSRSGQFFPQGIQNEHDIIFWPASWGLGTFTKGIFEGGFVRLKSVGGALQQNLNPGDIEADISLSNGNGFTEPYYVYQSLVDFQQDLVVPFIVS